MNWTVVWHADATNRLTEVWLEAADRNAVSQATDDIDRKLRHDAEIAGEEFYGDRLFDVSPLSVVFRISESDRLVTVLDVWHNPDTVH